MAKQKDKEIIEKVLKEVELKSRLWRYKCPKCGKILLSPITTSQHSKKYKHYGDYNEPISFNPKSYVIDLMEKAISKALKLKEQEVKSLINLHNGDPDACVSEILDLRKQLEQAKSQAKQELMSGEHYTKKTMENMKLRQALIREVRDGKYYVKLIEQGRQIGKQELWADLCNNHSVIRKLDLNDEHTILKEIKKRHGLN